MDKKQVIGLFLIGIILIGFQFLNAPSEEELAQQKAARDSIAQVERQNKQKAEAELLAQQKAKAKEAKLIESNDSLKIVSDSLKRIELQSTFGDLYPAAQGTEAETVVETDLLQVVFTNKGARIKEVTLKEFTTYDGVPLKVITPDSTTSNLAFSHQKRNLSSGDFYFKPTVVTTDSATVVKFKAQSATEGKYLEMVYALPKDDYMVDMNFNVVGISEFATENNNTVQLNWALKSIAKEKGRKLESQGNTIFFQTEDDKVDYLSEATEDEEILEQNADWVAFKQQFFSVALIPQNGIKSSSLLTVAPTSENSAYIKSMNVKLELPMQNGTVPMKLYLGPNNYNVLKGYGLGLEDQINLGWVLFRWISKGLIIPLFDLMSGWGLPVIVIIITLTIVIKAILFPITYKTYMSSAKMKALKPEIDEINKKYEGKEGADLQKQQEVMGLYRETGVNPFAGCIPMLIQFPVLIAMYRFFPTSIELRQQGFLWAEDLSTYDSIVSWTTDIPLISSFYGNHVSGFTLLMAISMIFYTRSSTSMNTMSGPQAQQMKIMQYMMPVMMIFWFNSFSAGLSIYYFVANMTTMGQQFIIKKFIVNEDKLRAKLQENKKKPKKKSRFAQKMEELSKQQQDVQNRKTRRMK